MSHGILKRFMDLGWTFTSLDLLAFCMYSDVGMAVLKLRVRKIKQKNQELKNDSRFVRRL